MVKLATNKEINRKIDMANEDHCGPCGEYIMSKTKKLDKKILLQNNYRELIWYICSKLYSVLDISKKYNHKYNK